MIPGAAEDARGPWAWCRLTFLGAGQTCLCPWTCPSLSHAKSVLGSMKVGPVPKVVLLGSAGQCVQLRGTGRSRRAHCPGARVLGGCRRASCLPW